MVEIGKTFDGTIEGAISATSKLNGIWTPIQKFMTLGDFKTGISKKIDGSSFELDEGGENIQNYVSQIANLDRTQQDAIISATKFDKENENVSETIRNLTADVANFTRINSRTFESALKNWDKDKILPDDVSNLMAAGNMKNGDNYALPETDKAVDALETYINTVAKADEQNRLYNAGITEMNGTTYVLTQKFKQLAGIEEAEGAVKTALTAEQQALNIALALGKQLMLSLGIAAVTFGIQKLVGWLANLKSHSDQILIDMSDAHDKAEQAQNDIDNVNQQLEDLNKQIKDAGADSIDDIVDPNERKRIQAVNDSLQAQLKLKQQILKTNKAEAKKKAEEAYSDKTETSIEKYHTVDEITDNGVYTHNEGDQVTKADSLAEHARQLDNLIDKRKQYETTEGYEDSADYLKNENEIGNEIEKINTLSTSVSEMQENLDEASDAYQSCTDSINLATDALAYSNGNIDISATKVSQLADKIKELDDSSKSYYDTVTTNQKYVKYGNIDNTNRGVIRWTKENLNKYSQFAEENGVKEGGYSTVLGSKREFNNVGMIAFSPILQTKDGVVPLTDSEVSKYLDDVISKASKMDGGATADNILKVDADGITETVAGTSTKVKGMIAAVEGQIKDGVALTAADVAAISGDSAEDLKNEFGETSKYIGYSMHDIQKSVEEIGNGVAGAIANIQDQIPNLNKNILAQMLMTEGTGFTEKTQKGFEILYEQMNALGFEVNTENCKAFAAALEKLGYISDTTADRLAKVSENKDKLNEATQGLSDIQKAYSTLSSVVDEYNKNGYLTVSTLSSLIDLGPEYYDCLVDESGQLAINTENINTMADAYYEMAKAALYAQAIESLNSNTNTYANASKFLEQAQQEVKDMKSLLYAEGQRLIDEGGLSGDALATQVKAQERIINTYSAMIELLDKTHAQSTENQFRDPKDKSSSNSSKKNTTDPVSAWKTMSAAMEEYNQQGALCVSTLTSLMDLEDEYTSLLDVKNGKMELSTSEFKNLMLAEIAQANASDDSGKSAAEFKKVLEWVDGNVKENTISYWQLVAAIEGYSAALEKAKGITDTFKDAWDNGKTVKQKTEKSRTGALDYEGTEAQSSALQDLLKYSEYDPTLIEKAYNQETGKIDLSGDTLKTAVVASLREQAEAARTEGGAAADAIAASYEKSANNIEGDVISVQDYFDGLGSTIDEINEKIDDMQSAWTDLNDVTNEYNIYDGLSVDALQKLLTMSPEYLACLQLEGEQLSVNADLMKDMLIKQLKTKADLLESKDETRDQAKILRAMIDELKKGGISALSGLDQYAKNLEDTLSNIKSLFSDLLGVFEQFNTDKSNDLKIQGDAWLEVIDKRIDALNEQNDAQERAIELSKAQDALEKAKANKTVHVYHAGGSGFEWEADQNAVRDAQSTLDDTIRKNRKEDEIEQLNKLKKAVQENNELIGSSFEDYEKKKKYLAEFDKMTYDDMISYNENWKNSILGNMKSTQVVTNVNEIITKIEKLVTTLETLNNVLTAIRTHGKSTDGGGLTGLFSKNGLFGNIGNFISTAKTKGLETAAKETIGTFLDNTGAALEANADNPIIKAATGLWDKLKGIFSGKIVATGVEAGVDETLATLAKKEVVQKGAGNLLTQFGGAAAATGAKTATTVTTGISSIPVVGTLIAVAVNNAVQQFGKISKENTKIWADQNSTTGEKIVSSIGNVLYHLSPVEGWDKSVQYAKMAAEGEGLWQKLEYGAKSLYYATGLGVILDNIWSTIKSILKVFGVKFKEKDDGVSTSSSVSGKKGVGSWKIWPWNWGKKAKGDKKIKKSAPYNVDEEGDEIIVRKPQTGRMTYLEKGDGVIPANETENLMTIGKNPLKWLTENVGKILGSSAAKDVVEGKVDEGAVTKASQVLANSVVNTFSSAWNTVKMSTEDLIDSMNDSFQGGSTSVTTAAGTILGRVKTMFGKFNLGKLLGSFSSGVSGAISKSAKEYSSTTELLSGTKSKTIDTMNKMRSTFESTWASVAKETGVSKDKITSISSEMFSKMETLVNQTYDAIDSNAGMSSDQLNDITKSLFQSMQSIYTSGWNAVYATSTGMSQETANTLNSAYKSSSDGCTQAMNTIRNTMVGSWEQCGGGVQNLANGTYQTLSKAWADSSGSAEKMLYDTRACFDSGWGAVEQGVSNLANNPKDKLSTAWAEITSQSNATFGAEGTLKTDADNAWKNVEPGATNLSKNMQWTMDQAYLATKNGCSDTVNSVNANLNSTSAGFSAIASAIDAVNKKASDSEEVAKKTGHAWYEWVLNPVGTLLDTITKYNTEDKSKNNFLQNAVHTVTHPVSSLVEAGGKALKYVGNAAKNFLGGLFGKHASGLKSASKSHFANVDELGPELLVRKPQSGRYTYLETGDGVVPADITSKLFEMGGNPNKWFSEQMAKYGSQAITTKSTGNTSFSTGNIVINTPVGNSEDLASEIKKNFSTRMAQEWNKR